MALPRRTPLLVALLALLLATVAGPAGSQAATELNVSAHDNEEGEFWFEVEGMEGRNPTITLPAGSEVTVTLTNEGQAGHNIRFGPPVDEATEIISQGESATLTFTVPMTATAETTYWCDPHSYAGMEGPLEFSGGQATTPPTNGGGNPTTPPTNGGGDDPQESTPFVGVALALLAIGAVSVALARRRR